MACRGVLTAGEGESNVRLTLTGGGTTSIGWRFLLRFVENGFDIESGFPSRVEIRTDNDASANPGWLARVVTDPGEALLADGAESAAFGISPLAPFFVEVLVEATDDVHLKWWAQGGSEPGAYLLDSTLAGQSLDHVDLIHRVSQLTSLDVLAVYRSLDGGPWELVDDMQRAEGGVEFGPPNGDVAADDWVSDPAGDAGFAGIICATSIAWDVYAAGAPNGEILATIQDDAAPLAGATARSVRVALNEPGQGGFRINRYSSVATEAVLAENNVVKCRFPWRDDYDFAFILEKGDFLLAHARESAGEEFTHGGRGLLAYLERAIMDAVAYTTGLEVASTWTEIWQTNAVPTPVGVAVDVTDLDFAWVISRNRRVYQVDQATREATVVSGPLWPTASHYAAGLSFDPSDVGVAWALEAPWLSGSGANTKIHKLDRSSWAILDTFDLGSAVQLTDIRVDAGNLWTTRYDNDHVQQRSKVDGSVVASSTVTYNGVVQEKPNGIAINGTSISYWFGGTSGGGTGRALLADTSDPFVIIGTQKTTGVAGYGGEATTEGVDEFLYVVSVAVGATWKYQLTSSTPVDPVDGIWRLDEATAIAILWRIISEAQAGGRPQEPLPDLTIDFDPSLDSAGNVPDPHDGTLEFDARIVDSVLATALRLIPFGVVERMTPELLLRAFNASTYGVDRTGAFGVDTVRFEKGVNIIPELGRQTRGAALHSHFLAVGQNSIYARGVLDDLGYVREGGVVTDLADLLALEGTANALLNDERVRREKLRFSVPIGDDPANGIYLPWTHYDVGDFVTLHTGDGEFDFNEETWVLYAFTLEEGVAGDWPVAVLELGSASLTRLQPADVPSGAAGSSGSGSSAGGSGSGGATSAPAPVFEGVDDTGAVTSTATGRTIRGAGFQVYQAAAGVVGIVLNDDGEGATVAKAAARVALGA